MNEAYGKWREEKHTEFRVMFEVEITYLVEHYDILNTY